MTRLDLALVERGLVSSRTKAQRLIADGQVSVDGVAVTKPSTPVDPASDVTLEAQQVDVGRGASKLRAALSRWMVPVAGATCVDIGASTGGFTQVLLEHQADRVVAVDVGHGQLEASLRDDPRVVVREGVHAASLTPTWWAESGLPKSVSVVVVDVSFISLGKILPALVGTFGVHSHYVLLVKPQFEVGRTAVSGGVVKNVAHREQALTDVAHTCSDLGVTVRDVMVSPITGEAGNVEYLAYASATSSVHPAEWDGSAPKPTDR